MKRQVAKAKAEKVVHQVTITTYESGGLNVNGPDDFLLCMTLLNLAQRALIDRAAKEKKDKVSPIEKPSMDQVIKLGRN